MSSVETIFHSAMHVRERYFALTARARPDDSAKLETLEHVANGKEHPAVAAYRNERYDETSDLRSNSCCLIAALNIESCQQATHDLATAFRTGSTCTSLRHPSMCLTSATGYPYACLYRRSSFDGAWGQTPPLTKHVTPGHVQPSLRLFSWRLDVSILYWNHLQSI